MVNNEEYPGLLPHRLGREERSMHIWVDKGDKMILRIYKNSLKCSMTAVLHFFIGTAVRCHEEKHLERIAFQEDRIRSQARIIHAYLRKYGRLRKDD